MRRDKTAGRFRIEVSPEGAKNQEYVHGVKFEYVDGFNETCPTESFHCSVEELRDIHYIAGRALATAGEFKG
jgi:hypothetical protein